MSDSSSDISLNPGFVCDCYKKLQTYGIPLRISDENDLYAEHPKIISYENAFQLPGFLEINDDITDYVIIEENDLSFVFQHMAQVIPKLSDFDENVLSFWILDMILEGLWSAQSAKMNFEHQKATLLWIIYFYNYIQKHNPTRRDLFKHLKTILFQCDNTASKYYGEEYGETDSEQLQTGETSPASKKSKTWDLPLPPELNKSKRKPQIDDTKLPSSTENNSAATEQGDELISSQTSISYLKNKENATERNLTSMKIILDILYRIFGRLWVYLEIQTVLHAMPPLEKVDLPFVLGVPKPLLKSKPPTPSKVERGTKKLTLSEKSLEEIESERQLHKNDYILPLQAADEAKLYMKQLFPQPASQRSVLGRNKEDKIKK